MAGAVLVVGLGNPGPRYEHTRHNAGAMVIDELCERLDARLTPLKGVRALRAEARLGDVRVILGRPTTYMNESGEGVAPLARYYKIAPEDVVIVHDEIDLPLGTVRIKRGGGDAGHNGLKSVTRSLKTREYVRVRAGVGRPGSGAVDHVLGGFSKREEADAGLTVSKAADAVETFVREGLDAAQERHNDKPERPAKPPARAVRHDVLVPATPEAVFDAWTTVQGVRSFMAPDARIELRQGGAYEPYFDPDAPEGARGAEGCVVLAFERPRLLVFTWNAPPSIPTIRAGRKTRVEIVIEPESDGSRVSLTHTGWGRGDDWDETFAYFERAWRTVLDRCARRFRDGPIDWSAP